ncbi:MAG: SDR family NAD(P)-dependent oxidoreductase [Flavipsychrobacter sp.]|nr:SDR family NAD(P)-dependent oxidoreductase [Flavipsychrobacter sp.]
MPNAIITGATHGIGKAIAEKLLSQGFSIAICARNVDELAALQSTWQQQYPAATILCLQADLSNKADVAAFADEVLKQFPVIDVLVNNAGIFYPGNIADEPDGRLETIISINLFSAYHLTRKILPLLKQQQSGHIFNMCSVASLKAYAQGGSYGISKYALLGFSDNLREELMPDNIKVTAISPGATYSRSWEGSGVLAERMMECADIADMLWAAYSLSATANVEHIVLRPIKGDL